uniref:NADH-ubiquinone oxidoreductase chain 4L n=1 Tax=Inara alboguttata TaxID=1239030 RepID=A0A343W8S2_9HEMI|nr:NADH dehydrogenase subunit 4L [Inara alboguttata]AVZ00762.1 NADH dehydrogenase subunit 4L [Inara alboguttata]
MYYYYSVFMIFMGLFVFCSMRKHLLLTLLSLEFLVLALYFMFYIFMSVYGMSYYFVLVFLTFAVCEGALGLSILVTLIRGSGNDSVSSLSVLSW